MNIKLMQHSSLEVCAHAIRTCWQSFDNSDDGGEKDKDLINRVGNKFKHSSTLEHLTYTFYISGVSRALLQELARHRMASPSVKSTRYTLKELKEEETSFLEYDGDPHAEYWGTTIFDRASKYLVLTGEEVVDRASVEALERLRLVLREGISNDKAKYCLPESYKTELTWTINARSLQNFISLRSTKAALWEIRDLANALYETLPQDHRYLFQNCLSEDI
jgi:thymidylate synthase (FAD)